MFTLAGLAMAGIGVLSLIKPIGDITWPGSIFFLVVGLLLAAFSWKMSGYDPSEFDRLFYDGSGRPMPESERESWIRQNVNRIGRDAYPDYREVEWTFRGVVHQGWYTCVETEPTPADPIGWPRLRFVLRCEADASPTLVGGYGLDETGWELIFTASDGSSEWEQLCGRPNAFHGETSHDLE